MQLDLSKISFPVYKIGTRKPTLENDTRWTFLQAKTSYEGDTVYRDLVLDDTSIKEDTLARRRMKLAEAGSALVKLGIAIFFIGDLLKLAKSGVWFIDSEGQVFEYKKTARVPLVFKPITNITPTRNGGAIIEVQGIAARFKVLFLPDLAKTKYAGLLLVGMGHILYGLYDQAYDKTTRVV